MAYMWLVVILHVCLMFWAEGLKVNLALRKTAWTTLGTLSDWSADKVVDGYTDIYGEGRTCFHGASSPSDWTVDLGQEYQLYDIKVYLRDKFLDRIANSVIYTDKPSHVCYTFPSVITKNPTDVTCNVTTRYVTIKNPGFGPEEIDSLNICEVEIYGCSVDTYGASCTTSCGHCDSLPCDRWTGVCSGHCEAGYRGNKCEITCSNATYGVKCKKKCSDRKCNTNTASCDHVTGSCVTGCLPGWMGPDCTEVCANQNYGSACSSLCAVRYCDGISSCHPVTGSCDRGCKAGWEGADCTQECDNNHYGPDCTGVCDTRHCEGSSSCSPTSGQCDRGCQTGWTGTDCKQEITQQCDNNHYGPDCTGVCDTRHCEGSSSCSPTSGLCDRGCQTGWTGTDCKQEITQQIPSGLIVGSVTAVVVFIVIVVIVNVGVWRKKRPGMKKESSDVISLEKGITNPVTDQRESAATARRDDCGPGRTYEELEVMSRDHKIAYNSLERTYENEN